MNKNNIKQNRNIRIALLICCGLIIALTVQGLYGINHMKHGESRKNTSSLDVSSYDSETAALISKAEKLAKSDISDVFCADYDGDGKKELFAVAGGIGLDIENQQLIFVSSKQKKEIKTDRYIADAFLSETEDGKSIFTAVITIGALFKTTHWYSVENGRAVEHLIGGHLQHIKGDDFTIISDSWDLFYSSEDKISTGHTYKVYYLKWNGKALEDIKSKTIDAAALKKYKNGAEILKEIEAAGYTLDDIIERENGIININVHIKEADGILYDNVNLKINGSSLETEINKKDGKNIVEKSSYGGIYKERLLS